MSKPSSKRTLLWDWTLTRDHDATPALQSTTASLTKPSSRIASITNWNSWRPPELPAALPFRPMIRTPAQLEGNEWDMIRGSIDAELRRDPGSPVIVHTFNEPERIPLSVAEALRLWRTLILPLRQSHGDRVKLVSPACASDPPGSQWLDDFMTGLPDECDRPDILGLHFYTMPDQTAEQGTAAAKVYFEERRARFKLPVVISELASTSRDPAVVDRFTRDLSRWLEARDQAWVIEYGIFGVMREVADDFVSPAAQMLDAKGDWTGLGRWWVGLKPKTLKDK
ncbi:glycoside hydrolase family 128 protein [Apiospora saccharicola]|uniref:Glycoside hydrolase family 128 protein n=1 Tax=Apiospora saccharicola TaxID=335842 RepID=A0ABR1UJP3_9PEZI